MSLISAILVPAPDGTLHLPLPEGWGGQPVRVKAELELVPDAQLTDTGSSQEALARLRQGFHLGGGKPLSRDETHAR